MQSFLLTFIAAGAAVVFGISAVVLLVLLLRGRRRQRAANPDGREVYLSYNDPDFIAASGFRIEQLPGSDILSPQAFWLVDSAIAEVEYNIVPAQRAWLRIAPAGHLHGAQANEAAAFDSSTQYKIGSVAVLHRQTAGGFAELRWRKGDYDYMLYAPATQMNALGGVIPLFVNETAVSELP